MVEPNRYPPTPSIEMRVDYDGVYVRGPCAIPPVHSYRDNAYEEPARPSWFQRHFDVLFSIGVFALLFLFAAFIGWAIRDTLREHAVAARASADRQQQIDAHNFYCGGFGKVAVRDLPADCLSFWSAR